MAHEDCIFCRIATGEIPADMVRQDDEIVAFRDLNPQASTHVLVVPRRHIPSVEQLGPDETTLIGRLILTAREIAREEGINRRGYRLVVNTGPDGGQTVDHIHVHLLGGRHMGWPPG